MKQGGTVIVRGTMSNKFFKKVYNGKAEGMENFDVVRKVKNISSEGYFHSDGVTPVRGSINEVILQKK